MVVPVAFGPNRHVHDDALVVAAPILAFYHLVKHRIACFGRRCRSWVLGTKARSDELSVFKPDSETRVLEVNVHDGRIGRCEFYFAVPVAAGTCPFHRDGSCGITWNESRECGETVLNRLYPLFLKGNENASTTL